jgi:hypothetical protein
MRKEVYKKILTRNLLLLVVATIIISSLSITAWAEPSTINIVSTRDHVLVSDRPYEPYDFRNLGCTQEVLIYVHGVWTARDKNDEETERMFENAIEVFDRARFSLESLGYTFPVIGFSWDSDTALSQVDGIMQKK